MFERLKELLQPKIDGSESNFPSVDDLPVDDSNADGDHDASNPEGKGE